MYSEETDLSYRLRQRGWETHFVPGAEVIHHGGASTSQYAGEMTVQLFRSELAFHCRHRTRALVAIAAILLRLMVIARLVRDLVRGWFIREAQQRRRLAQNVTAWWRLLTWHSAGQVNITKP